MRALEYALPNTGLSRWFWTQRLLKRAYVSKRANVLGGKNLKMGDGSYLDDYCLVDATYGKVTIGRKCGIMRGTILEPRVWNGSIRIGDGTWIEPYCIVFGQGGVTIGKDVALAPRVTIAAYNHAFPELGIEESKRGVVIGDGTWVGMGAQILDGVTIGKDSVIGAGAVVTRNIPPASKALGNPARVVN